MRRKFKPKFGRPGIHTAPDARREVLPDVTLEAGKYLQLLKEKSELDDNYRDMFRT